MTPCNGMNLFACHYNTCTTGNFTVSGANVVLQDYQKLSLGAVVTVSAATTDISTLGALMTVTANATAGASSPTATLEASVTVTATLTTDICTSIPTSSSPSTSALPAKENNSSPCALHQSSKLAGVGAGVGAPLAIALAVALALLGRQRRKARSLELENARLVGVCQLQAPRIAATTRSDDGPSSSAGKQQPPSYLQHPALRGQPIREVNAGLMGNML